MVLFYAKTVLHLDIENSLSDQYYVKRQGGSEIMTFAQILLRVNTDRVRRNFPPFSLI
jgi:hypothetical protein